MSALADSSAQREEGRISAHVRSSSCPYSESGTAAERFTDDLIVEILSRVPVKSLCRFKCVSNHWLSLIHHPGHRKKLPQTLAGFFYGSSNTNNWLLQSPVQLASVSGRSCPPVDTTFAFLPAHERLELLDCCNGLLLCRLYDGAQGDKGCYVVCNPAMEKWVVLPESGQATADVVATRLGFDPAVSPHFHVFQLVEDLYLFNPDLAGVAVYSSETGAWVYKEKGWNTPMMLIHLGLKSVFANGYLHFEARGLESRSWLAMVDTEAETWMNLHVPAGLSNGFIQQSQGHLYYTSCQRDEDGGGNQLVVYVLEDYDSKEWILTHTTGTSILRQADVCASIIDWVAIHPKCSLIFFTVRSERGMSFMCYNMDRRQVKEISNLEDVNMPYLPYVPLYADLECLHN